MLKLIAVGVVIVLCYAPAAAAQPSKAEDDAARKLRLDYMKEFLADFAVFRESRPADLLTRSDELALRFSNPIRNFFSDGGLFLWFEGKRPVVAASLSIRGNGQVWLEMASLSAEAFRCTRGANDFWTPRKGSLVDQRIADAPAPATSSRMRLVQMRRLSEQFAIRTEPRNEQPCELRLLPQPIYRYDEETGEALDGGLFAFTETTDPEALLLLEAVPPRGGESAYWRYTLAKMTSRPIVGRLDGKTIWTVPGYWTNPRTLNDPYNERQLGTYAAAVQEK